MKVKVLGVDDRGKVKLSMKAVDQKTGEDLASGPLPKPEERPRRTPRGRKGSRSTQITPLPALRAGLPHRGGGDFPAMSMTCLPPCGGGRELEASGRGVLMRSGSRFGASRMR